MRSIEWDALGRDPMSAMKLEKSRHLAHTAMPLNQVGFYVDSDSVSGHSTLWGHLIGWTES